MTTNNSITTLLDLIAEGNSSPKEFLQKIDLRCTVNRRQLL